MSESMWWRNYRFAPGEEWPAFLYELDRHTSGGTKKRKSWPARSSRWRWLTMGRIPPLERPPLFMASVDGLSEYGLPDFPGASDLVALRVDLTESDRTISERFLAWVAAQRRAHRVEKRKPNAGKKRALAPWRYIELQLASGPLNNSESSQKAKGRGSVREKYLTAEIVRILRMREPGRRILLRK